MRGCSGPAAPDKWASWGAASRVCHQSHRRQAMNWAQGLPGELSQEQKVMEPQVGLEDKAAVYIVQSIQETGLETPRVRDQRPHTELKWGSWVMHGQVWGPSGASQGH